MDVTADLMSSFEKILSAGFPPGDSIIEVTNFCMREVIDKKGISDDTSLQKQIDLFLKNCGADQTSPIPGNGLLVSYSVLL